jgi:hypothetical protein
MSSIDFESRHSTDFIARSRSGESVHRRQPWYEAYMTALFEPDVTRISEQICRAEKLMMAREREIFGQPAIGEERTALDRAFYALRALQFCTKSQT